MKMVSVVPLPGTNAKCILSIFTIWWMEKSITNSSSFITCSLSLVITVKGFAIAHIEVQNEAFHPVESLCQLSYQLNAFVTSRFQHLRYEARRASNLAAFRFSSYWALCRPGWQTHWEAFGETPRRSLLKPDFGEPGIVLSPWQHLAFVSEHKLSSIVVYTVLTNDILVRVFQLFGDKEQTGDTVVNSIISASDFASQKACFATRLASL